MVPTLSLKLIDYDGPEAMLADLGGATALEGAAVVAEADLPRDYRLLLAHQSHMTAVLETYWRTGVRLEVVSVQQAGDVYQRQIMLRTAFDRTPVEAGLVRLDLSLIPPAAVEEILARRAPLGDVLIRHNVMRRIEPRCFAEAAQALLTRRRIEITAFNRARNEVNTRIVSPQRLVHYRQAWYLDAWCHRSDGLRRFAALAQSGSVRMAS